MHATATKGTDMASTTIPALDQAADIFKGDWDANGTTSIHLPQNLALDLLRKLGWEQDSTGRWTKGNFRYWDYSEALAVALAAEALA